MGPYLRAAEDTFGARTEGVMALGQSKIPATVITGFPGAGKTTVIRNILEKANGRRIALIINEFGDVGVDGEALAVRILHQMANQGRLASTKEAGDDGDRKLGEIRH